jgi:predicted acyltransferase
MTNFTFEDTLTQIGLGYTFLVLSARLPDRWLWTSIGALLFLYWLAWALYPLPGQPFSAHWAKGENLGTAFDRWFLNLFPRPEAFVVHRGGYGTLSFIPTLGTMMLGLLAGRQLLRGVNIPSMMRTALILLVCGLTLHFGGVCPIVKRIWTPAWTLASGGACFFLLSLFRLGLDGKTESRWAFPLLVVGANSIAAYLIAHWWDGFFAQSWRTNFIWVPMADALTGWVVLALEWLCLWWMYRRKIFLKI